MAVLSRVFNVVVHPAEEGGYWAEVLGLPGCVSQGETWGELHKNITEAIEAVLQAETEPSHIDLQLESTKAEKDNFMFTFGNPTPGSHAHGTWTAEAFSSQQGSLTARKETWTVSQ